MPKDWAPPTRDDSLEGAYDDVEDDDTSSSEDESGFLLTIKTIMGTEFSVLAYPSDTIELLQTRIAFQQGIPQKDQNLFLGRRNLNDPNTTLNSIGLNEDTASSKSLRLVTNLSSGLPFKGLISRDPSPPPLPFSTSFSLPFIPNPAFRGEQTAANGGNKKNKNPDGTLQYEDEVDGVLVFRDSNDNRVFVVIKVPDPPKENEDHSLPLLSTRGKYRRRNPARDRNNRASKISDYESQQEEDLRKQNAANKQMERVRENARTLEKMNEIKMKMTTKKKSSKPNNEIESLKSQTKLPDINLAQNISRSQKMQPQPPSSRRTGETTGKIREIIPSAGQNGLNKLRAEIYLENQRSGGGPYGRLPYTDKQLCQWVNLKVRVLLEKQHGYTFKADFFNKFEQFSRPKRLTPTVLLNLGQEFSDSENETLSSSRRTNLSTARLDSTKYSVRDRLRDNFVKGIGGELTLKSILGSARGSSRQQRTVIIPPGSSANKKLLRGSARQRPQSGIVVSIPGTASSIQKKKKDAIVRCFQCHKRIGLACRYQCRCGKTYCATHRYAEAHECTYDYKGEGRRQIQADNPVIVASKVDKI